MHICERDGIHHIWFRFVLKLRPVIFFIYCLKFSFAKFCERGVVVCVPVIPCVMVRFRGVGL